MAAHQSASVSNVCVHAHPTEDPTASGSGAPPPPPPGPALPLPTQGPPPPPEDPTPSRAAPRTAPRASSKASSRASSSRRLSVVAVKNTVPATANTTFTSNAVIAYMQCRCILGGRCERCCACTFRHGPQKTLAKNASCGQSSQCGWCASYTKKGVAFCGPCPWAHGEDELGEMPGLGWWGARLNNADGCGRRWPSPVCIKPYLGSPALKKPRPERSHQNRKHYLDILQQLPVHSRQRLPRRLRDRS